MALVQHIHVLHFRVPGADSAGDNFPHILQVQGAGIGTRYASGLRSSWTGRGISITGIYSFNLSKDTKKANAGFTGIGRSKRIILSDTLIEHFTPDEIAVIFAHEMGHYKKRHIVKSIVLGTVSIFLSFFLCGELYRLTLAHLGYINVYDIAAIPILFFYLTLFSLVTMPLSNALSRRYEREADRYALDATRDRDSFISSMEKLAELNLADRDPNQVTEFMFYSHPSIKKRIALARSHVL